MQKTVFIYALRCPITGLIRYVGKSANPTERFSNHLKKSDKPCHRVNWIRSLQEAGEQPVLEILDEVPESEWQQWEVAYIEFFRESGYPLVNGTSGGEGVEMTAEIRAKIGAHNTGSKHTPEQCAKWSVDRCGIGNPMAGKTHTPEAREKQRLARLGKKQSPETRAKISRPGAQSPSFGKKKSPEQRAKQSAAMRGRRRSPEACAAIGRAQIGRKTKSNTSGFVGVRRKAGKWQARLCEKHLGYFRKIEDAVFVRNLAVDKYYGNRKTS